MSTRTHPYRSWQLVPNRLRPEPEAPLETVLQAAKLFLLVWASLRVAVCTFCGSRGIGFEVVVALIVIVSLVLMG